MRHIFHYIKQNKIVLWIIMPAFIFHLMVIFPSGSEYCFNSKCGIFFWGAHGHDAVWHLALAEKAFTTIPFNLPIFAGESLKGYNYLFDLVLFVFSKLGIPPLISYFKLFPIFWFGAMTYLSIRLARKIHDSPIFVTLLLFFVFFGGSFGYLLSFWHNGNLWGSAGLMAMQSGHTLINPPYAISLLFIMTILNLMYKKKAPRLLGGGRLAPRSLCEVGMDSPEVLKSRVIKMFIFGLLIFFTLAFKFYGGVIAFVLIVAYYFLTFLKDKNYKRLIGAGVTMSLFFVFALFLFYNPAGATKSGAVFSFDPLATIHPFIEDQKLFYLQQTVLARYYLKEHGIGPRLLYIETLTLFLFLLFNFGTRTFGFLYVIYLFFKKKISSFDLSIIVSILAGIFLSAFFVQKGQWWNTIQFFYYSIFLANIYAALFVYHLFKQKKLLTTMLVGLILVATVLINFDFIHDFASFPAPSYLPKEEFEALQKLKNLPDGIVLTNPYRKDFKENMTAPVPLYAYDDTAYITVFSGKKTYVTNETQLILIGVKYQNRLNAVRLNNCEVLEEINYIYEIKPYPFYQSFKPCLKQFDRIFSNNNAVIYSKIK